MAAKTKKKRTTKPFDDFVMHLYHDGKISDSAAFCLTRNCKTPKQRELFYQMFVVELLSKCSTFWKELPVEKRMDSDQTAAVEGQKAVEDYFD